MPEQTTNILASADYAVLRHGGAPPEHARLQLRLGRREARQLEALFSRRWDVAGRPRFAQHAAHVAAVLLQGEFPVLPERRR